MMLVCWELTSLSSFRLIGFWRHDAIARQGARLALVVTGGGGLALIAGMLLLGDIAGSFALTPILQPRDLIIASPLYTDALMLGLLRCFTKIGRASWRDHVRQCVSLSVVAAASHNNTNVKYH